MKEIKGDLVDLFDYDMFDVMVQGNNCFNTMNSGIAKQIREKYPRAYEVDQQTIKGDVNKLGAITVSRFFSQYIVNAYTQFNYGYDGNQYVDYQAVANCFTEIKNQFSGKRIAFPLIGCGLAGGDWNIVSTIIEDIMEGEDITLVRYQR